MMQFTQTQDTTDLSHKWLAMLAYEYTFVSLEYPLSDRYEWDVALKAIIQNELVDSRWVEESPDECGWYISLNDKGRDYIKGHHIEAWQGRFLVDDAIWKNTLDDAKQLAQLLANQTGEPCTYHIHGCWIAEKVKPYADLSDIEFRLLRRFATIECINIETGYSEDIQAALSNLQELKLIRQEFIAVGGWMAEPKLMITHYGIEWLNWHFGSA